MRSSPPITLRTTPDAVYLVGSAAGPLGGDHTRLQVEVGAGARLSMRSAAASIVLPGAAGGASTAETELRVRAGGVLCWLLEPMLLAKGGDHHTTTRASGSTRERPSCSARSSCSDAIRSRRDHCARTSASTSTNGHCSGAPCCWVRAGPTPTVRPASTTRCAVAQALVIGTGLATCGIGAPIEGVRSAVMELGPDAALISEVSADPGRLATNRRQQTGNRPGS